MNQPFVNNPRILLAVDGSAQSFDTAFYVEFFDDEQTKWFCEAAREMETALQKARNRLVESGMSPERIATKVRTGMKSRAGAIVDEAKLGGYGTIVLGRKGLTRVPEFFMGRVSNKVIHMAKEKGLWIVS